MAGNVFQKAIELEAHQHMFLEYQGGETGRRGGANYMNKRKISSSSQSTLQVLAITLKLV